MNFVVNTVIIIQMGTLTILNWRHHAIFPKTFWITRRYSCNWKVVGSTKPFGAVEGRCCTTWGGSRCSSLNTRTKTLQKTMVRICFSPTWQGNYKLYINLLEFPWGNQNWQSALYNWVRMADLQTSVMRSSSVTWAQSLATSQEESPAAKTRFIWP